MTSIKELKKDAKVRLTGSYLKLLIVYLIYDVTVFAFSALGKLIQSDIAKVIYLIFLLIFVVPLAFGLISCLMDIIRGKKVPLTDFINVGLKNIGNAWKVHLHTLLRLLIPIILTLGSMYFLTLTLASTLYGGELSKYFLISAILCVISMLILFVANLYYSFSFFILKDKPNKTGKEIVNLSRDLIKGNLIKYVALGISFIGWYLLIFAICCILQYFLPQNIVMIISNLGSLILFPYITTTIIGFYEDVLYDKMHSEEKM